MVVAYVAQGVRRQLQLLANLLRAATEHSHSRVLLKLGVFGGKAVECFDKVGNALSLVCNLLRHKEDDASLGWQTCLQPCLTLVGGAEDVGVDGVGYGCDTLSGEQRALLGLVLKPVATRNEVDVAAMVEALLALPHLP